MPSPIPMAVPTYSREDYDKILAMLPLAESESAIPYVDWVAFHERNARDLERRGFHPVRVKIEAAAVKVWCERENLPVCRASIRRYGLTLLSRALM